MQSRLLSLRPPQLAATPELRWVLLRAFGPVDTASPAAIEPARAAGLAVRLGLAARIGARHGLQRLAAELGRRPALDLAGASGRVGEREDQLRGLIERVGDAFDLPFVLLKFAALEQAGLVLPGSRYAGDLDVLVAPADLNRAAESLGQIGFLPIRSTHPPALHQLAPMVGAAGIAVEIHRWLPGVRVPGGRAFADLDGLKAAGALTACGENPSCLVPSRDLLTAHLLAHGLIQHGFAPRTYGPMRTLGDLIDVGMGSKIFDAASIHAWVAGVLTAADTAAVASLCRQLASGDLSSLDSARHRPPEAALLAHFIAGLVDDDYDRSLRTAHLRSELRLAPSLATRLGVLLRQRIAAGRALSFAWLLVRRRDRRGSEPTLKV